MSITPEPVESTWKNMGVRDGRLWHRRELTGKFFIHASIRTVGDRATLLYSAELACPDARRVKMTEDVRTLTDVLRWGLACSKVEAARVMSYADPVKAAAAAAESRPMQGRKSGRTRPPGHYKKPSTRKAKR